MKLYVFGKRTQHEKWSFPLRISSVNVTKSTVSCGFLQKKYLMENFIFCAVVFAISNKILFYFHFHVRCENAS